MFPISLYIVYPYGATEEHEDAVTFMSKAAAYVYFKCLSQHPKVVVREMIFTGGTLRGYIAVRAYSVQQFFEVVWKALTH